VKYRYPTENALQLNHRPKGEVVRYWPPNELITFWAPKDTKFSQNLSITFLIILSTDRDN